MATVERCGQCYLNQYVLGKQPSSTAVTTGTLFHDAAAGFYESRQKGVSAGDDNAPPAPTHPDPDQQSRLDNAVSTMTANAWDKHEVLGVEELFFMDIAPDLPPVIGVIDLVVSGSDSCLVVDHKTCRTFADQDPGQLVLYAEHVRRSRGCDALTGAFDEYRLVPNLARVKKPVFRRTQVDAGKERMPDLIARYRRAWTTMQVIHRQKTASRGHDCWFCRRDYVY